MTRLGVVILPEYRGAEALRIWRHVEELGVHHGWTFDHLSWRSLRDRPWFDAPTTLAAVAVATDRMVIGTLVTSPNFRHPVTTAKQAMTLDHLSGGRFTLGIGAGATGADTTALGGRELAPDERADRFAEFVTMLDVLLRQPETTFRGRFYQAVDVPVVPGCVQTPRVPFAVAAAGDRGMRLAARHAQTWVTIGRTAVPGEPDETRAFRRLRGQVHRLATACEQVGRNAGDIGRLVNISRITPDPYASPGRLTDLVGRCAELGFTDVVLNFPRKEGVFAGDRDGFDRAVGAVLQDLRS